MRMGLRSRSRVLAGLMWLGVLALGGMVLPGCAAGGSGSGGVVVDTSQPAEGGTLTAGEVVSGESLYPMQAFARTYEMTTPEGEQRLVGTRLEERDGKWLAIVDGLYETHLQVTAEGAVVALYETSLREKSRAEYDPPVTILPARMQVGEPVRGEVSMRVVRTDTGRVREQGTCRFEIELIGKRTVTTPKGEMDLYIVQVRRDIRLRLASVVVRNKLGYMPEAGPALNSIDQTVRVLGLLPSRTVEMYKLAPDP